jgi:hypothetical protein
LENPDWERGEAFFPTARRNDGEGRDLRLRSNAAVEKKGRRPHGDNRDNTQHIQIPPHHQTHTRSRSRFLIRLLNRQFPRHHLPSLPGTHHGGDGEGVVQDWKVRAETATLNVSFLSTNLIENMLRNCREATGNVKRWNE